MKPRRDKNRIAGPFVPLLKDTMKSEAWRAASHGARSLYVALKSRYNSKLGNGVYLSTRAAETELGSYSCRDNVRRWFRELQYYGFIVMVSPGHLGVEGRGKAPHWRLTEEFYQGERPTRDFEKWNGEKFREQKSPKHYVNEKQNPGPPVQASVDHPFRPLVDHPFRPPHAQSGPPVQAIHHNAPGPPVQAITSLTTPILGDGLDIPEFLRRQ
jgi:hypothetical protein